MLFAATAVPWSRIARRLRSGAYFTAAPGSRPLRRFEVNWITKPSAPPTAPGLPQLPHPLGRPLAVDDNVKREVAFVFRRAGHSGGQLRTSGDPLPVQTLLNLAGPVHARDFDVIARPPKTVDQVLGVGPHLRHQTFQASRQGGPPLAIRS